MTRPIQATIDLAAIRQNYLLAKRLAPNSFAFAVIKADAYGHGYLRVAQALAPVADGYGLINIENALAMREAGITQPILLLEGCFDREEVDVAVANGLWVPVHSAFQLDWLRALPAAGRPLDVFIKINTGMNRLGFRPEQAADVLARLRQLPQVRVRGLMTHFATADDDEGIEPQLLRFDAVNARLDLPCCVANSAATLRYDVARREYVRPGIMLYGASPFADQSAEQLGLAPTMKLEADIIGVQELQPGDRVGYGARFTASQPMRIGVVACGYADGYPRIARAGTPCVVDGVRTRLVGRVSMDMLTIDLDPVPQAGVGSKVTLWGGDGLSIDEVAAGADTIGYELMCALAARVPVVVVGE